MNSIEVIDPAHSILLVMDYQNGIIGRLDNADELLSAMADAIASARSKGLSIGYVRVALAEEDYSAVPAHNAAFRAMADQRLMNAQAPETQVHELVAPKIGDIVVRKKRVGAFSTTDLDSQLKARGITTIILAGISTSGVLLSTVRDAADKDYRVIVLSDLSADPDPQVHQMLMEKVFPRQAKVMTWLELESRL